MQFNKQTNTHTHVWNNIIILIIIVIKKINFGQNRARRFFPLFLIVLFIFFNQLRIKRRVFRLFVLYITLRNISCMAKITHELYIRRFHKKLLI